MLYFLLFFLIGVQAQAAQQAPAWVEKTPADTSEYKFYVKCGKDWNEIQKNAIEDAIRDNYGSEYESRQRVFETLSDIHADYQSAEDLGATVRGFKEKARYTGSKEKCALYSYAKSEIEKGKKNLKQNKKTLGKKGSSSGYLDITTTPASDAEITIDGQLYSERDSDVKLALTKGKHKVVIDHPHYEKVTQTVEIASGMETPLTVVLKPVTIKIRVDLNNDDIDADVFLNGRKEGKTPASIKLTLGQDHYIKLTHPEFREYVLSLPKNEVSKRDDGKVWHIGLEGKDGFATFTSTPKGADIFIDDARTGKKTPAEKLSLSRGKHTYKIVKDGFLPCEGVLTVVGGKQMMQACELKKEYDENFVVLDLKDVQEHEKLPTAGKTPAPKAPAPVIKDNKGHNVDFTPLPVSAPKIDGQVTKDNVIKSLMRWDYPDNFLRAYLSFNAKNKNESVFYLRVYFDEELYQKNFITKIKPILKKITKKTSSKPRYKEEVKTWETSHIEHYKKIVDKHKKVYRLYDFSLGIRDELTDSDETYYFGGLNQMEENKTIPASIKRTVEVSVLMKNGETKTWEKELNIRKFTRAKDDPMPEEYKAGANSSGILFTPYSKDVFVYSKPDNLANKGTVFTLPVSFEDIRKVSVRIVK